MKYDIKCDCCGKFIAFSELKHSSYLFIPDSDVSREEEYYRCKECTEKEGKPRSIQQFSPIR